jgi:hypothetical protein
VLFQPIDDKTECVGVYVDGSLIFDETQFPQDLSKTWKYTGSLSGKDIEYAWLYTGGSPIGDVCPPELVEEWARISKRMNAYKKSFDIAKVDLREHCFFDLVPQGSLLEFCEIKNKITDHVLQNHERPKNYEYLRRASELLYKLKYRNMMLDSAGCRNLFLNGGLRASCQKILAGPKHIDYNLFGTVTGRLSTHPGSFPMLTMKKELRSLVKPHNDWFLSLDYNGAEVRTLLALAGQQQPDYDIHQWNIENVFEKPDMHREEAKTLFFAWLYNPDSDKFTTNYYDREKVLDKHYDGEYISTVFGRHIKVGQWKAFNYLIQSTTSDLVLERAMVIDDALEGYESCISHIVHDEIVVDFADEDRHLVPEIKELFAKNKLGTYVVNLHAGKDYYNLERLTL